MTSRKFKKKIICELPILSHGRGREVFRMRKIYGYLELTVSIIVVILTRMYSAYFARREKNQ